MIAVNVMLVEVFVIIETAVPDTPPTFTVVTLSKFVPLIVIVLPTYPDVPDPGLDATTPPELVIVGDAIKVVADAVTEEE